MVLNLWQGSKLNRKKLRLMLVLSSLLIQSACYTLGGDAQDSRDTPHVSQVYVEKDSLNLRGTSLDRVQRVFLRDTQGSYEYQVQSQNASELSSNAKNAFELILGRTYDLIVMSADAEEVSQVTLSLNGSLGGSIYGNVSLLQGKLGVGSAWNSSVSAPVSLAHIVSSVGGGATEGLTVETLTSTQSNYASFFPGGASSTDAGYIQFGVHSLPNRTPAAGGQFFIGSVTKPKAFVVSESGDVYVNGGTLYGGLSLASPSPSPLKLGNSALNGTLTLSSGSYTYSYSTNSGSGNFGFTLQGTVSSSGSSTPTNRFQIGTLGTNSSEGTENFVIRSYPDPSPTPSVAGQPYPSSIDALVINRNTGMPTFTTLATTSNPPNPSPTPASVAKFRYIADQTLAAIYSCDLTGSGLSCSSDRRLKKDIEPITGALSQVLAVEGVSYRWKASAGKKELGFIAQDLEKVVPEIVSEESETKYKQVAYAPYVAILNQAIKELYHKLFSSTGELEKLRKRSEDQDKRIESLEKRLKTLEERYASTEKLRASQGSSHSK